MELTLSIPPKKLSQEVIEIGLWESFLTYHANLRAVLVANALGYAPLKNDHHSGRVTFRFDTASWRHVKHLLYENRIPLVVRSGFLQAVQQKGATVAAN